jgi:hypothetical protein
MTLYFSIFLVLMLGSSSYAVGRLHGGAGHRSGYRQGYVGGYRQGYVDGDRAWSSGRRGSHPEATDTGAWRRHREARTVAATIRVEPRQRSAPDVPTTTIGSGTTYLSASFVGTTTDGGRHAAAAGGIAGQPAG